MTKTPWCSRDGFKDLDPGIPETSLTNFLLVRIDVFRIFYCSCMPFLKHGEPSVLPSCFQPSAVLVIAPIAKWKIENIGKKNKKRHRCCLQWKYFAQSCKSNWLDWAWQFSLCTFSCAWEDCGSNSIHLGPFSSQQSGVNVFLFSWRLPYRAKKSRTKCRICINKWTVFTTGLILPNMIV